MTAATALDPEAPMTPAELAEAVVDALRTVPDPVERYRAARDAEPLMKAALAQVARNAVNEMWDAGLRGAEIAAALGVSRQRVEQLVSPDRLDKAAEERLNRQEEKLREQEARLAERQERRREQELERATQRARAQAKRRAKQSAQRRVTKVVEGAA